MNIKKILYPITILVILLIVSGCAKKPQKIKTFKHNTPLIKNDIKAKGKVELEKTLEMGPKPVEGDIIKLEKRTNHLISLLLKGESSLKWQDL